MAGNWDLTGELSTRGIADERWTYYYDHFFSVNGELRGSMDIYTEASNYLEPFFRDLPCTIGIPGGANMRAYYTNYSECINEYGLTDSSIAHSPILNRARIGHEKMATEAYLQTRHVDFELGSIVANLPNPLSGTTIAFQIPTLGLWQLARVVRFDTSLMNELARRFEAAHNDSRLPLYQYLIPEYINNVMPALSLGQLDSDYAGFRKFYFDRYPHAVLQGQIEARIEELKRGSIR
jgi:hypothetical protein